MKKVLFVCILLFFHFNLLFSQNNFIEYIVLSNNVNIMDNPTFNSNIIRKVSFPEILIVYEITGSGTYQNGVFDKWAKISNIKSEWINYYYIVSFPFVISGNNGFNYDLSDLMDYNTIIIKNYLGPKYSEIKYFTVERNLTAFHEYNKYEYTIDAKPIIDGISLIDNPWTRLYFFCDKFQEYIKNIDNNLLGWRITIENDIILEYGIRVGMNINDVIKIFGNGYEKKENIYHYVAIYFGYGHELYFYTENNKITKIIYSMIK